MAINFTNAQRDAINDRGHTLLVSAAAGSGKTAVLIERIFSLVTDPENPCELDQILAVTFTNAAAEEIRQRLLAAFTNALIKEPQNRRLLKQLALIPTAKIYTIDAFFLDVIRKNFDKIGLSANFSVCSNENSDIMLMKTCEGVAENFYESEKGNELFYDLVESTSAGSSDEDFIKFLFSAYNAVFKLPDPEEYLDFSISEYGKIADGSLDYLDSSIGKALKREYEFLFKHCFEKFSEAFTIMSNDSVYEKFSACLNKVYEGLKYVYEAESYLQAYEYYSSWENPRSPGLTSKKIDPDTKAFLTSSLKEGRELISSYMANFPLSEKDLKRCCLKYSELIGLLKIILLQIDKEFTLLKRNKCCINFADMKRLCYKLLFKKTDGGKKVPTELAREIAGSFKEIFIDEYQDTDNIQDEIFKTLSELSGANRFMVGDVKQCIYAFRNSKPELFMDYYNSFPDYSKDYDCKNARILLSENFRSDGHIIDTVNLIFSSVMKQKICQINYGEAEKLIKSKSESDDKRKPCELFYTECEDTDKSANILSKQAKSCANEIARLINEEGYLPSDIAVLVRKNGDVPIYKKALAEGGVLVNSTSSAFTESAEIRLMLSILKAIDNPTRDIPLASALCSPLFNMSLDEIAQIYSNSNTSLYDALLISESEKAKKAVKQLGELREYSKNYSIDKLIFKILKDSGLDRVIKLQDDGERRYKNVLKLVSYANSYDDGDYRGLSDFLSYCDKISAGAPDTAPDSNGVSVITVHKSKGLEYKVCFVTGLERSIFSKSTNTNFWNEKYPCAFPVANGSFSRIDSPTVNSLRFLEKTVSEEIRIFYVALTRAKERLYMSFCTKRNKLDELCDLIKADQNPCDEYSLYKSGSFAEWVFRAIADKGYDLDKLLHFDFGIGDMIKFRDFKPSYTAVGKKAEKEKSSYEVYPEYVYPYLEKSKIPAKLSVSELSDDGKKAQTKYASYLPSFMEKAKVSGAEIGTAMHEFMQFCDFKNAEEDIEKEANRVASLGFITKRQRQLLNLSSLSKFFESGIYKQIKTSKRLYRELRYNLFQNADEIYDDLAAQGEKLLVQGVIDCFFETECGDTVVLDFKTDRVNKSDGEEVLRSRHTPQLELYKKAIEQMLGKKVDKTYIYSFDLEKEILC